MTSFRSTFLVTPLLLWGFVAVWGSVAMGHDFDYNASIGARLLPRGIGLQGVFGYDYLLWGEKTDASSYLFGYLRPSLTINSSVITNRATAALDFYPIAIMGFSVGVYGGVRNVDIDTLDCTSIQYRGSIYGGFAKSRLIAGLDPFFMTVGFALQTVRGSDPLLATGDEFTALIASAGGDQVSGTELTIGAKISDNLSMGLSGWSNIFSISGDNNSNQALFALYSMGEWSYLVGVGLYSSNHHTQSGLNTFVLVKWTGAPALDL